MATKYVRKTGSDSNNGTTPLLAYLTIGKALGASGIASGDTVYIGAGTYRETVTVAMTSATVETKIIADLDGSQTGDAGEVVWTAFTTNDTTAVAGTSTLNLAGRDFLTFQDITFIGGAASGGCVLASTLTSTNITFRRCAFNGIPCGTSDVITCSTAANTALHWLIDSCILWGWAVGIDLFGALSASVDYDIDFVILNSRCMTAGSFNCVALGTSGSGSFKPGGLIVRNSTVIAGATPVAIVQSTSTSVPSQTVNSILFGSTKSISAFTAGSMTEDYNMLIGAGRTNVTAGTHSQTIYAPALDIGQSWLHGFAPRPFLTPMSGAPMLGFGDNGTAPATDVLNRPRPAGGNSASKAIGAFERHDTAAQTASPVHGSVSHSWTITGPGDHEFSLPVDASAQTPSVYCQYDSSYGAGTKPQLSLRNGGGIGVADQDITMSAVGAATWAQLTLGSYTPTAKGVVTIRFVSSAAASSVVVFSDFAP